MEDWSRLSHAYGSAEDVPALVGRVASGKVPWNDLWSFLCHQGSVRSASFAALPLLAAVAEAGDPDHEREALWLAGAILASTDRPADSGDVRGRHAAVVVAMTNRARARMRVAADHDEYLSLARAWLELGGVPERRLAELVDGWSDPVCPACATSVEVVFGDGRPSSTAELLPAAPADLSGMGARLHGTALADGQPRAATAMTYVFGAVRCPTCAEVFPL